ncbi:hypothetical protein NIES4103_17900 [Nostoc sp. NIES-4103]|nr:hypothetical protein NIES4103_17900 [Nostoc sp. NIES-4103]
MPEWEIRGDWYASSHSFFIELGTVDTKLQFEVVRFLPLCSPAPLLPKLLSLNATWYD